MKNAIIILVSVVSLTLPYKCIADNGRNSSTNGESVCTVQKIHPDNLNKQQDKIACLAIQWYGEGTKIEAVTIWKAMRIVARGYDTDGEKRWLVLFPEIPIGMYNAIVVIMTMESHNNNFTTMSEEARKTLLSVSNLNVVSGVATEKRLNDLVVPYLTHTIRESSKEWTQGTYYYHPVEIIHEYTLSLQNHNPDSDWVPRSASVYIDENGFLIHHKVTSVETISREHAPQQRKPKAQPPSAGDGKPAPEK